MATGNAPMVPNPIFAALSALRVSSGPAIWRKLKQSSDDFAD
jgi:hypothetical protein